MITSSCPVDVVKIFLCGDLYVCQENSDQDFYSLFSILNLAKVLATPKADDNSSCPVDMVKIFLCGDPSAGKTAINTFIHFILFIVFHFEFGKSTHYTKN